MSIKKGDKIRVRSTGEVLVVDEYTELATKAIQAGGRHFYTIDVEPLPKIRIVVDMHGGTVESVCTDSDVELDVVFLEEPKHVGNEDDCYEVEGGLFEGQAIYTHYDGTKVEAVDIDPVFAKAEKRLEELE